MNFLEKLFGSAKQEHADDAHEPHITVPKTKAQKDLEAVERAYADTGRTTQEVDEFEELNPDFKKSA